MNLFGAHNVARRVMHFARIEYSEQSIFAKQDCGMFLADSIRQR